MTNGMCGLKQRSRTEDMLKVVLTSKMGAHIAVIRMDLQNLKNKTANAVQVILDHAQRADGVRCVEALTYKTPAGDWHTLTEDVLAGLVVHTTLDQEASRALTLEVRVTGSSPSSGTEEDDDEEMDVDEDDGPAEVHERVLCDACDMYPIIGRRYKSLSCNNFDVCQACFLATHKHLAEWVRIRSNVFMEGHDDVMMPFSNDTAIMRQHFEWPAVPPIQEEMKAKSIGSSNQALQNLHCFPPGRAAAALQAVAARADDSICEAALTALLGHHDEAIRKAVANELDQNHQQESETDEESGFCACNSQDLGFEEMLTDDDIRKLEQSSESSSLDLEDWTLADQSMCIVEASASAAVQRVGSCLLGVEAEEEPIFPASCDGDIKDASTVCIARIRIRTGHGMVSVPASIPVRMTNDGTAKWTQGTSLMLVSGDGFGLEELDLDELQPGQEQTTVMDLHLPSHLAPGLHRSVWEIVDGAGGERLGPRLVVEVKKVSNDRPSFQ